MTKKFYPFWIKIYEDYYGPLPKDSKGRKYEVHHKDGNRDNNAPENLEAISIEEHYKSHHEKGNWLACLGFLDRLEKHDYIDYKEREKREKDLKRKSKKMTEKCPHCGETFKSLNWGILRHIKYCKNNPDATENIRMKQERKENKKKIYDSLYWNKPGYEHWMRPWEVPENE